MSTIKYFFVRLYFFLISLGSYGQSINLQEIGLMPTELPECSGFAVIGENAIASINDSGNDPEIFVLDSLGNIIHHTVFLGFSNHDWESIAYADGLLYIGDFGNNANKRTNLKIYIVDISRLLSEDLWAFKGEINFSFPDQHGFPPADTAKYFDLEAMVVHQDSLYLFTKNRTKPFDGLSNCYSLSRSAGSYKAHKKGQIFTGQGLMPAYWISGACLNGDHNPDLYLLGYDKIWRVRDYFNQDESIIKAEEFYMGSFGQREAICILNNKFYIGEERVTTRPAKFNKANIPVSPKSDTALIHESLTLENKQFSSQIELVVPDTNLQGQLYFEIYNQGGELLLKGKSQDCRIEEDKMIIDTKNLGLGSYIINTVLAGKPRAFLIKKTSN
tara:strand:- start:11106 stop:12266 length:1161 start_codon:yes stop_codon:yes gene_type:complete